MIDYMTLQGERFSVNNQVENFENTLEQLRNQMDDQELKEYLGKSLAVLILGSNDYLNNYLLPSIYPTSYLYNTKDYADLLIKHYTRQILVRFSDPFHFSFHLFSGCTTYNKIILRRRNL